MREPEDNLAVIDASGAVRPLGDTALLRLQAREGVFQVLPAPPHLVVMRHAGAGAERDARSCILSGEIRGPGALCDVISFIGHAGYRGELFAMDGGSSRSIYLDQGAVIGAHSTVPTERLGQVLHRHGVLTEEQAKSCADTAAASAMRFGEAAVRAGLVSREKLFEMMGRQIEEIFYGLVLVSGGMFYFLESFDDATLWARQKLSVSNLIREGVRRMHETRYFQSRIPSDKHVPVRAAGREPPEADPLQVYASIDGRRSVADLCRLLGRGDFEVSRALFQLVQSGHVAVRPPRLGPAAAVGVYNQAVSLILRELDAMDEGDAVRQQLTAFAANKEYYRQAFEGAGPADDGTLDARRIAENVARAADPREAEEALAASLYEYASYALFLARPHLRRAQAAAPPPAAGPGVLSGYKPRLSQKIAALLDPIAPARGASAGEPRKPPSSK